ncbi:hypothetical protein GN244_ATG01067 [Phytophthora infestans]|uniref:Uncharacterized protein n=1 Tax=Phytophthora infestans TaxID=4787 RepID=A0A833TTW6_PHYIN|nr:hypothetical protein GN244_ATG01067 [Phytophthora infestans]
MFVPSPPGPLHSTDEDGDEEDPGDGISDGRALAVWAEYLEEVFRDEEIDSRYAAAQYSVPRNCIDDDNEFEAIPTAVSTNFRTRMTLISPKKSCVDFVLRRPH